MTLRPLKLLLMAGAGWTAVAAVPALGAPCDQQFGQVREQLTRSQLSSAERREYHALFLAARAMQQNGDEQVCIEILKRTQGLLQQRAAAPDTTATTRTAAADGQARAARSAVLTDAEPFAQIARFESIRGLDVVNSKGEDLGRIVDLVVDFGDQQVQYALLSMSSGLFGDNKLYPVPVDVLKLGDAPASRPSAAGGTSIAADTPTVDLAPADDGAAARPAAGAARDGTGELGALAQMTVGELVGSEVKNNRDESIGEIDAVILPPGAARIEAVLSVGGVLGIGDKSVAIPLDRLAKSTDGLRFKIPVTEDELKRLPKVTISDQERLPDETVIAKVAPTAPTPPATGFSAPAPPSADAQAKPSATTTPPTARETGSGPAVSGPASGGPTAAATADGSRPEDPLANKVLVLDIDRATLEQAPGFTDDAYPNLADADWHRTVLSFYENVLHLDTVAAKTKAD
jgi:sporulation protein YlmC with PRC-barrel domain